MAPTPRSLGPAARRAFSTLALALAAIITLTATASAHPGHGVTPEGNSAAHYLLEPVHGLGVIAVLAVAVVCAVIIRARSNAPHSQQ